MADVKVRITGDNRDVVKKIKETRQETEQLARTTKKSTDNVSSSFRNVLQSLKSVSGVVAGGLGIAAASAGFKAFGGIVREVMAQARRQAEQTQRAFESAFSSVLSFNVNAPAFEITTREQAVAAGRIAKEELNRISQDLQRNFGSLVNSSLFSDILSGALTVSSIAGIGEQQKARLSILLEQKGIIETQLDKYREIEQSLVFQEKVAKQLAELGVQRKVSAEEVQKFLSSSAAPVSGLPDLFELLKLIKDSPTLKDFLENKATPKQLANALPAVPERRFDEAIDTQQIVELGRIIRDENVAPFQRARAEVDLYRESLAIMIEQGISPSSEAFQATVIKLKDAEKSYASISAGIGILQESLLAFADIATDALDRFIFKLDSAVSAGQRLKNLGRTIFNTLLRAGIGVAVGALTGNPITFGAAIGSAFGVVGESGASGRDSLSLPSSSLGPGDIGVSLSVEPTVLPGGDILIGLRSFNASRDGRGGRIDI